MAELSLVGPMERALHMRSLAIFEHLPAREIAVLAQIMKEEYRPAGAILCQDSSSPAQMRLLVDGRVRNEKRGRVLDTQSAPSLVGLSGVLGGRPAAVCSRTETPATLLAIDAGEFLDVLEDRFAVFLELRRFYAAHVSRLQRELRVFRTAEPVDTSAFPPSERPLGVVEQLLCLQRTQAFRGVPLNVLAPLVRDDRELRIGAGETLWRDGDPGALLIVLIHGHVRCGSPDGPGTFVAGPGFVLGADAAFGGVPYAYDAITESPIVAVGVSASRLTDMIEDHFELGRRALAHFAAEEVRLRERRARLERA